MFSPHPSHVVPAVAAAALAVGLAPTAAHAQPTSAKRLHVKVHATTLLAKCASRYENAPEKYRSAPGYQRPGAAPGAVRTT